MFIFITPRIMRNPGDSLDVTKIKEEEIGKILPEVQQNLNKADRRDRAMNLTVKGYERLQAGDLKSAKDLFLQALEIDPGNPFAMMNMGVVYEQEGETELALQMYQAIITSGTSAVANISSDPSKTGTPLLQIARESIERITRNGKI